MLDYAHRSAHCPLLHLLENELQKELAMKNYRENYLAFLNHEPLDWIPNRALEVASLGGRSETWENGPMDVGGMDGFGNNWIPTESAGNQPALDPTVIPLDDVCDWEDKVTFPDLDAIDWQRYADEQLAKANRKEKVLEYHTWNSVFLRFTHLLGFENALCSFFEEPEASKALCNEIADYKIALLERVAKYMKPDAYVHYNDVATERSLFISPETYREFIKPCHIRMNEAARSLNIIPEVHICGKCESIIEDIIEEGSVAWQSAQPMNDIAHIIETYGDKLGVVGGYDTQGIASTALASEEQLAEEVDRCYREYGRFGRSYSFLGFLMGNRDDPVVSAKNAFVFECATKHGSTPKL